MLGMKDKNGKEMAIGDVIKYQGGTEFEVIGDVKLYDGVVVFQWCDNGFNQPIHEFWYAPMDEELTEIINR